MNKNWNGLIKILEIQHIRKNKVIWRDENLYNIFHSEGEKHILTCAFDTTQTVPTNYYLGLDSRPEILAEDTLADLLNEPSGSGYIRASINTSGQFQLEKKNGIWRAISPIFTFVATGGSWGPVSNLFMSTTLNNSGYLVASAYLSSATTVVDGDAINLRMGLSLQDAS